MAVGSKPQLCSIRISAGKTDKVCIVRVRGRRDLEAEWHWRNILNDWDSSGLNGAEYCRNKGITYSQFRDWRIEIRKRNAEIERIERESSDKMAVEQNWRQIIAECRNSGLSGAEYCRRKDIIYWHFADWKQRLVALDRKRERDARNASMRSNQPNEAEANMKRSRANSEQPSQGIEFAEVKLLESLQNTPDLKEADESRQVEVVLPTGIVVRLGNCTVSFLSSVIATLENP
jgi:hypothetical protein